MLKNLKAKANSTNPKNTFTVLSQEPDLGNDFNQEGKKANKVNGIAKANPKENIPSAGFNKLPPAACTNKLPAIGPVQENDTNTMVNAIKNTPYKPPFSDSWSTLFTNQLGNVISNMPKNDIPKSIKTVKNKILGNQWVLIMFAASAPKINANKVPIKV